MKQLIIAFLQRDSVTVIGAFLLSFLAFFAVLFASNLRRESVAEEEVLGTRGVERSAWVALHDNRQLVALVRVVADTRTMTMRVVGYPPQTEVVCDTTVTTVREAFSARGESAVTLIEPDEVITLSVDAAASLMGEWAGNVVVTLPQAVHTLAAGEWTVTPLQAAQLLRFEEWEDGMVGQARMAAQLTAAVLDRALHASADVESAFGALATVSDTRLHISVCAAPCEDMQMLAQHRADPFCTAAVAAGYTVGAEQNRRYVLADTFHTTKEK